jgi:hypothetical protein
MRIEQENMQYKESLKRAASTNIIVKQESALSEWPESPLLREINNDQQQLGPGVQEERLN